MRHKRTVLTTLILAAAASSACAAVGDGKTEAARARSHVATVDRTHDVRAAAKTPDTERVRQAGEQACRDAVGGASAIGETFARIGTELLPLVVETGEEFARQIEPRLRELEPALKDFGDRVRALARHLEQSYLREPPEPSSGRSSDK